MPSRPPIPSGKAGILILAAATVPLVLSRCKPLAKKVGEKMIEWGEKLQKDEKAEAQPTAATATTPPAADEAPKEEPKAAPKSTATKPKAEPKKTSAPKTATTVKAKATSKKPKAE